MTSVRFISTLLIVAIAFIASGSSAFAPSSQISSNACATSTTHLFAAFDGEQDRKALTRESEPEEFFATWVSPIRTAVECRVKAKSFPEPVSHNYVRFLFSETPIKCLTRRSSRLPLPVSLEFPCLSFLDLSPCTPLKDKAQRRQGWGGGWPIKLYRKTDDIIDITRHTDVHARTRTWKAIVQFFQWHQLPDQTLSTHSPWIAR